MPVDLSTIPAAAQRSSPPSFKRWLFFLVLVVLVGGTATLYFWPADKPTQTLIFWCYSIFVPALLWLCLFAVRGLLHTFSDCVADGWDEEREWTLERETQRGQRSVNVLAQAVHLPHAMTATALSRQMLAKEIGLPSVADGASMEVIRQARFDDIDLPQLERLRNRIVALLVESALNTALARLPASSPLRVALLVDTGDGADAIDLSALWQSVLQLIPLAVSASVVQGGGVDILDNWLDKSIAGQRLLVIAVHLAEEPQDGAGDAAVALLLQTSVLEQLPTSVFARIHRPQGSKTAEQLTAAVEQSLHWGGTQPERIRQIWLTGMGCDNQALSLFSSVNVAFSAVVTPEQLCDIDIYTGLSGKVSPWLALAIAVDHAEPGQDSQLIMSVPATDPSLPWFTVVHSGQQQSTQ